MTFALFVALALVHTITSCYSLLVLFLCPPNPAIILGKNIESKVMQDVHELELETIAIHPGRHLNGLFMLPSTLNQRNNKLVKITHTFNNI